MDPKDISDYITIFKEAIALAESHYREKEKINHYVNSKRILKELDRNDQEHNKLNSVITVMCKANGAKRRRLGDLQDALAKRINSELVDVADIKGKLNKSVVPSDDMKIDNLFDMQPYLQQVNHIKQEIEELDARKANPLQLPQEINDYINQAQTELEFFFKKSCLDYEPIKAEVNADLKDLNSKLIGYDRPTIVEKVTSILLGEQPLKKEKFAPLVEETIRDILGKHLIEQAIQDQSKEKNIYPSEVNSLQIRERNSKEAKSKFLSKINGMKKETDEALSAVEDLRKIEHFIENLGYADHITKNHTEVLNFLNAPDGNVNKIPYVNEAKDIPLEISLYEQDVNLSTALVTSLTQYTKNEYFSDLEERLHRLEKEIQ